ncbi:Glycosyl transferase family 2 [Methylorubrum salsuginis]|uniref:Glycosyl transferase family 2 n=2 Tax=Methylorubrum salsuginis TaxID=414703 RepID=A0A1I4N131_9HYPH|nr:Glycosyl transferase family 2 [Methylorubrum salsuginis]
MNSAPSEAQPVRATIAIPLHNHAPWIGKQLDSLFAQWRPDFELLVVDDGSEDGGIDVVMDRLAARPDIAATVLRHGRSRSSALVDAFARYASAPVIIQADSDDISLPGRLDAILACFDRDPLCRLVSSNALRISESGIPMGIVDAVHGDRVVGWDDPIPVYWGALWYGATLAYHRSVFEAFPPMSAELCPYGFDLIAPARAGLLGTHHLLAQPLVGWRQHANNTHRRVGALSTGASAREHYAALDVMIKAQVVRDAIWLRDRSSMEDGPRIGAVIERCERQFMAHFETWARLRNQRDQADRDGTLANRPMNDAPLPDMPPVVTLPAARSWPVERRTPLAQALSRWPGFHEAEDIHIWTSRQVAALLRITVPDAVALALTLGGSPFLPQTRALVSINAGPEIEVVLPQSAHCVVEVPLRHGNDPLLPWTGLNLLSIRVPCADAPINRVPDCPDVRVLGAAIYALEPVVAREAGVPHLGSLMARIWEEQASWSLEPGPLTSIPGWLSEREMRLLYGCARVLEGPFLEMGAWVGRSTSVLARGIRDAGDRKQFVSAEIGPELQNYRHLGDEVHYCPPQGDGRSIGQVAAAVFESEIEPVLRKEGGVIGVLTRNLEALELLPFVTLHVGDFATAPDLGYGFIFNDCAHTAGEVEQSAPGLKALIGDRAVIMAAHDHCPEAEAAFRALFDVRESFCVDTLFVCRMRNRTEASHS